MITNILLILKFITSGGGFDKPDDIKYPKKCIHELDGPRPKLTKATINNCYRTINITCKKLRVDKKICNLLKLVAQRESSCNPGLIHRLNPDLQASRNSYHSTHRFYLDNKFRNNPNLWQTYGLFGMNSNYFTMLWDRRSSPEVLCDPVVDILVYLRAISKVLRKFNSKNGIRCKDSNGEYFQYHADPTFYVIHRAINGGKICPSDSVNSGFHKRSKKWNINPDDIISKPMLGNQKFIDDNEVIFDIYHSINYDDNT